MIITHDDQRIYSASKDRTIRAWDIVKFEEIGVMTGHEDEVSCLCVTSDGKKLISGGQDGTLRIWNTLLFYQEAVLIDSEKGINKIVISSDDRYIFTQVERKYIKI